MLMRLVLHCLKQTLALLEIVLVYLADRDVWCEQTLGKNLPCAMERYTFSLNAYSISRNRELRIQNLER